ncbi:DnaD domain-containing protein [Oceanobacillus polygoni]|uniref:DnaD/phage-associated family protein n=1 Tax=Oceanobacillus polygoni TaxID=1235259 RepID=A0A9X0YRY9_9BACI|nr:DnaD domain protein [Oceanobacillus polygoni]MBP2075886.1 DnaD/phage-associated family protein [Oceanobacillus polygoni]
MNYLKEINAFYDRLETNPLSGGAVSLWHALMQVNNRARWKKKFTVAVVVLCYKAGLSESSFKRARKELYEKGYIHYEKQLGNQAALYEMISLDFYSEEEYCHYQPSNKTEGARQMLQESDKSSDNLKPNPDDNVNHKLDGKLDRNADALIKQNNTIQNNTYTTAESRKLEATYEYYQQHFGKLNGYMKNELTKQIHDLGEDLVLHAMKKTLDRGKTNWNYTKAILTDWKSKGLLSLDQINLEEVKFKKTQNQRSRQIPNRMSTPQIEPVPDWFFMHKREQQEKHESNMKKQQDKDQQQLMEDVKSRLQAYAD